MTREPAASKDLPMTFPSVIAIDGPVASGKTTVGKALASRLGYRFIDTGMMYRACTLLALRAGIDPDDEVELGKLAGVISLRFVTSPDGDRLLANGEDITDDLRTPEVQAAVSSVASVSEVRTSMVAQQQRMAEYGEVVMVGRDIGTKVLPDAAKLYLDASVSERIRRRSAEEQGRATIEDVRANIEHRDIGSRMKAKVERVPPVGCRRDHVDVLSSETSGEPIANHATPYRQKNSDRCFYHHSQSSPRRAHPAAIKVVKEASRSHKISQGTTTPTLRA